MLRAHKLLDALCKRHSLKHADLAGHLSGLGVDVQGIAAHAKRIHKVFVQCQTLQPAWCSLGGFCVITLLLLDYLGLPSCVKIFDVCQQMLDGIYDDEGWTVSHQSDLRVLYRKRKGSI